MSEFKFACPVCGQHICADSGSSGSVLPCPTCFQNLVIPQAPASGDSKLILTAAKVAKRPARGMGTGTDWHGFRSRPVRTSIGFVGLLLVFLGLFLAVWHRWGEAALHRLYGPPESRNAASGIPVTPHPIPKDVVWTLDVTNARMPQAPLAGKIRGAGFLCERAVLRGGTLSLRQGTGWPPEAGVTIFMDLQPGEELSRRIVLVSPNQPPPTPRITLRWRDEHGQPATERFHQGYALKLFLGQPTAERLPGRIYVALPDAARSVIAGNFEAEIRPAATRR